MASQAPPGTTADPGFTAAELRLATRNHGMPLEALRYDTTPVGLHYLLIHYDIPVVDPATWTLTIDGSVGRPLTLSLEEIKARAAVTQPITFECAGNGRALMEPRPLSQPWLLEAVGTGEWTGTSLRPLLEEAELDDSAVDVVFTGLDRGIEGEIEQDYQRALSPADAMRDEVLLAYELNGEPLPPQHGFPLRLVVPGWYGMTNVKWLTRITALDREFDGYQQSRGYRFRQHPDDHGELVTRMVPRALMVPPGIPDFATRRRTVRAGERVTVSGRAWSGQEPIETVSVSDDGGSTWSEATLDAPLGEHAWRGWRFEWTVPGEPGDLELCCRANEQPLTQAWNLQGYANNAVQRVPVTVVYEAGAFTDSTNPRTSPAGSE